jgi:hypothetical protein
MVGLFRGCAAARAALAVVAEVSSLRPQVGREPLPRSPGQRHDMPFRTRWGDVVELKSQLSGGSGTLLEMRAPDGSGERA